MLVGVPVQLYLLYMRGLRFVQPALLRLTALALVLALALALALVLALPY